MASDNVTLALAALSAKLTTLEGGVAALSEKAATLQGELTAATAELTTRTADYDESLDTLWMLLATMLVFFMHPGFSLLEAGTVRFKNTQNILAKNLIVVCVGFICWYFVGWGFALGVPDVPNKFIGHAGFVQEGFFDAKNTMRVWWFQGAFCATGATIVSGAMAERTKLRGFAIYTVLMTSWIYPVVCYWIWSGAGWLNYRNEAGEAVSTMGPAFVDFAGSGVVHLVGGTGAIFGALLVGPRKDRYGGDDEQFAPHSIPLVVMGTFFLWFGWFGFNPGSTGQLHTVEKANLAAIVAVNTTLAPCVSGLVVFFLRARVLQPKRLDVGGFCNGILAGLVGITSACGTVKPWEALLIGLIAALLYQLGSMLLLRLRVDDVVDAFPVHCLNGLWGVLAAGLFGNPADGIGGNGGWYGGNQFGVQLAGAVVIIVWTSFWSLLIFIPLRLLGMLRMSDGFQDQGADAMEHSPSKAYHSPSKVYCEDKGMVNSTTSTGLGP